MLGTPTLPGLTLLRVLAHGGTSVVYLARQDDLDRLVAVKVVHAVAHDPQTWRHLGDEARTVAQLSWHPNIVVVHTAGETPDQIPYLVMEYLDAGSLADDLMAHGPLPVERAAAIGASVGSALQAAHEIGLVHGDVKPGNVLLDGRGTVKLGDFGIARVLDADSATTGQRAFTPDHVAPEVLRGERAGVEADVYGLASTVYTALAGTSPHRRRPDERAEAVLGRVLSRSPVPPVPGVPEPMASALLLALSPEPAVRPSLAALIAALRRAAAPVAAAPTRAMAVGSTTQVLDAAVAPRRSRWPWALAALLGALLLAGLLVLAAGNVRKNRDAVEAGGGRSTTTVAAATSATPTSVPLAATAPATVPPATVPPTAAPRTTRVPPTTRAAPSTVAATVPPTVAPQSATVAPAPKAGPPLKADEVSAFVQQYYATVAARDYPTAWSMLGPEFQVAQPGSYDRYVAFWNNVQGIALGNVTVGRVDKATAVARYPVTYTVNGRANSEVDEVIVRRADDGRLLISAYRVVSG